MLNVWLARPRRMTPKVDLVFTPVAGVRVVGVRVRVRVSGRGRGIPIRACVKVFITNCAQTMALVRIWLVLGQA